MADLIRFERSIAGSVVRIDCPMTKDLLTRAHVLRAWVRWLGADGWSAYGPYSVEVGYAIFNEATGALVETNSVVGQLPDLSTLPVGDVCAFLHELNHLGIGYDGTRYLDGYVRMWETRRNPLDKLEAVWKV